MCILVAALYGLAQLGFGPCYHMTEVFKNADYEKWTDIATGKESDFETVRYVWAIPCCAATVLFVCRGEKPE